MNKIIVTTACLLFAMLFSNAQDASNFDGFTRSKAADEAIQKRIITKGYYSIYNNRQKLHNGSFVATVKPKDQLMLSQAHHKGYYAIGDNHTEVHKGGKSFIAITPKRPVAQKGYYSVKRPAVMPVITANPGEAAKVTDTATRIESASAN